MAQIVVPNDPILNILKFPATIQRDQRQAQIDQAILGKLGIANPQQFAPTPSLQLPGGIAGKALRGLGAVGSVIAGALGQPVKPARADLGNLVSAAQLQFARGKDVRAQTRAAKVEARAVEDQGFQRGAAARAETRFEERETPTDRQTRQQAMRRDGIIDAGLDPNDEDNALFIATGKQRRRPSRFEAAGLELEGRHERRALAAAQHAASIQRIIQQAQELGTTPEVLASQFDPGQAPTLPTQAATNRLFEGMKDEDVTAWGLRSTLEDAMAQMARDAQARIARSGTGEGSGLDAGAQDEERLLQGGEPFTVESFTP